MFFTWATYQTFAALLSAGTTVVALSAAWLTFADQRSGKREAEATAKAALLSALEIEMNAMHDWTTRYDSKYDYSKDGGVFLRWHAPFYRPVHPIVHNTIATAASMGLDRGLPADFVKALLELEYQLNRFDRARQQIEDVTNNNLEICESLNHQLLHSNPNPGSTVTPTLSTAEQAVMRRFFELNRVLHVECIGEENNGPNLHLAYIEATKQLTEAKKLPGGKKSTIENVGHWVAVALVVIGAAIMVSAPFSFIIPPDTASAAKPEQHPEKPSALMQPAAQHSPLESPSKAGSK